MISAQRATACHDTRALRRRALGRSGNSYFSEQRLPLIVAHRVRRHSYAFRSMERPALPREPFAKRTGFPPSSVTKTKPIDPFPVSHSISVLPLPSLSVTRSGFAVITGARETRSELLPDIFCWGAARSVDAVPKYMATHTATAAITERGFGSTDRVAPLLVKTLMHFACHASVTIAHQRPGCGWWLGIF